MKNGLRLLLLAAGLVSLQLLPPVCAGPPQANPVAKARTRKVRQKPPVLPKPRLTVPLPDWYGSEVAFVAATPQALFFWGAGTNGSTELKRIERATGNLQWRIALTDQSVLLRNRTIAAQWQILGFGLPGKNGDAALVLQQTARTDVRSGERGRPDQSTTEWTLYGHDESASWELSLYNPDGSDLRHFPNLSDLWQYPTLTGPPNTNLRGETVVGNLLLLNDGSLTPVLWNAQTGKPIDRATPEGKALVEQAISANGSPLVQRSAPDPYTPSHTIYNAYRLDTGQVLPFFSDNPEESINVDPLGVTPNRALWYKNGDNGMAGHSGFASSLWCSDASGKTVWVYPARTYYNGEFLDERGNLKNPSDYARLYRDVQQTVLCGARTKEPVAVAVVRHGGNLFVDGLRLRDGNLLWSHPFSQSLSERLDLVPAGKTINGAFYAQRGQLLFLDAATGKKQNVGPLPKGTKDFFIADDDLITVDAKGILRIYSVKRLLGGK